MPQILSISSRVVRGTVGNTLAAFVLQRMGHEVWDVPTVLWDHHPGFGRPSGLVPTGQEMAALLADFRTPELAARTKVVLSGYCAAHGQIDRVRDHILALRADGHRPLYCCDPICGDAAGPYVLPEVLDGLRAGLVPLADVLTPNRHELGFLSGLSVESNAQIVRAARALGRPLCLVTSAFGSADDQIANLLVSPHQAWICETSRVANAPNGTGDLMTALFAGWLAHGIEAEMAMVRAVASVRAVLEATGISSRELAVVSAQDEFMRTDRSMRAWQLEHGDDRRQEV